jgi:hypothetical protein
MCRSFMTDEAHSDAGRSGVRQNLTAIALAPRADRDPSAAFADYAPQVVEAIGELARVGADARPPTTQRFPTICRANSVGSC